MLRASILASCIPTSEICAHSTNKHFEHVQQRKSQKAEKINEIFPRDQNFTTNKWDLQINGIWINESVLYY